MADLFAVRNSLATYAPGPAKPAFPRTAGFVPASRVSAYSASGRFAAQNATETGGNVLPFPSPFSQGLDSGTLSNALLAQLYSQYDQRQTPSGQPPAPADITQAQNAYRRAPGASFAPANDVDIPPAGPHTPPPGPYLPPPGPYLNAHGAVDFLV